MRRWQMLSMAVVMLSGAAVLFLTSPTNAQECSVNTAGPASLTGAEALTICATNLDAPRTVRLGVAFYDAFKAREPLRLEYFNLPQGAGVCTSFRSAQESLTVVARAGYMRATEDSAVPLALSAQVGHGPVGEPRPEPGARSFRDPVDHTVPVFFHVIRSDHPTPPV